MAVVLWCHTLLVEPLSHRCLSMLARVLKASLFLTAIVMLLTLPAGHLHQRANHFRSMTLRRTMVRYLVVAQPCLGKASEVAAARTMLAARIKPLARSWPRALVATDIVFAPVALNRMLMRFKLGHASSQSVDPPLQPFRFSSSL